jgi:alpha-D-ribose 1-methylphosphonate 5-triphosphate synthase subunit PhnH
MMVSHDSQPAAAIALPRPLSQLPLGFADAAADAQASFRAALQALSMPGLPVPCGVAAPTVPGLMPATVALLLALMDHETPVWWAAPGAAPWLQFHTGAPQAASPAQAHFAVCQLGASWPALEAFCPGTDASPERSTTLLVELASWQGGTPQRCHGPGFREPRSLCLSGLPPGFWVQWQDNHARFPSGVDVIFICGDQLMGLPRTTVVGNVAQGVS